MPNHIGLSEIWYRQSGDCYVTCMTPLTLLLFCVLACASCICRQYENMSSRTLMVWRGGETKGCETRAGH